MEEKREKRVFYVHGLEGSYKGKKGVYFSQRFKLSGVDMDVSIMRTGANINFPKTFFSNFFSRCVINSFEVFGSRNIFSSFSKYFVLAQMIEKCIEIQMEEWKKHEKGYFDVVVGSSWGGTLVLEMLKNYSDSFEKDQKFLLISPAHGKMYDKYEITKEMKDFKNVKIVHSKEDSTVPFSESKRICEETGWELIEIEGNDHGMYEICKDYEEGSLFDIIEKWE